jgi:hypothetical protein
VWRPRLVCTPRPVEMILGRDGAASGNLSAASAVFSPSPARREPRGGEGLGVGGASASSLPTWERAERGPPPPPPPPPPRRGGGGGGGGAAPPRSASHSSIEFAEAPPTPTPPRRALRARREGSNGVRIHTFKQQKISRGAVSARVVREHWRHERQRAQGRPGARCTRGLACKFVITKTHTSIQVQRKHSGLPCAVVLTVSFALSLVTELVCHHHQRFVSANLTPASGCQDHTTSPSA